MSAVWSAWGSWWLLSECGDGGGVGEGFVDGGGESGVWGEFDVDGGGGVECGDAVGEADDVAGVLGPVVG